MTHPPAAIAACLLFAVWAFLIALVQVELLIQALTGRGRPWLIAWKRFDLLGLCPTFTFFSYLPSAHYCILYRDRFAGSNAERTHWREIPLPARSPFRIVWNPARRSRFAVEDACRSLIAHLAGTLKPGGPPDYRCDAYRFLTHCIAHQPPSAPSSQRQWMMVQVKSNSLNPKVEPLFVSPWFPLPGESPVRQPTRTAEVSYAG